MSAAGVSGANMSKVIVLAVLTNLLLPRADTSRVLDSLVEYEFRRVDCLSGYAPDSSNGTALFGDLNINTSSVTCKGLGVEAKSGTLRDQHIISSLNGSLFVDEIQSSTGFTFEAWATFENFSHCEQCQRRQMVSIRSTESIGDDLIVEVCEDTSDLLFYQTNGDHSVGMVLRQDDSCFSTQANSTVEWGSPAHIVFTVTEYGTAENLMVTRWYLNGLLLNVIDEVIESSGFSSAWLDEIYLQVLNDAVSVSRSPDTYAQPSGSIFLLAMYDRPLNSSEVAQNYEAGLQNSPPVAEDISAAINEDGEVGDHYDTPEYYLQDPMVPALNLSVISLVVVDLDAEEGFPGFDSEAEFVPSMVAIESLPSRGALFDISGQAIDHVPYNISYDDGYHVRYRPVKDEFSGSSIAYTSFMYSAVDAITGEVCIIPGIVTIYVLAKNDPPVPTNMSEIVTTGQGNTIFLAGTDVDTSDGDTIEGARIVDPPLYGLLYQVSHG